MQRYEFIEGTASKFWEVEAKETSLTVRFGKIGTNGQTQTKSFDTSAAATKERDKLIKEKTGKGYKEVSVAADATLAAVAPKAPKDDADVTVGAPPHPQPKATAIRASAPTAVAAIDNLAPPSAAKAAASPALSPALEPGSRSVESLDWPSGGFQWTPEFEALVPIVRGLHAPPYLKQLSLMANPITIEADAYGYGKQRLADVSKSLGRAYSAWNKATSKATITRAKLMQRDDDYWLELFAQAYAASRWNLRDDPLLWVTKVAIAVHGIDFALDKAFTIACADPASLGSIQLMLHELRAAVAIAPDSEYQAAFAVASQHVGQSDAATLLCANVFAHHEPWVKAALAVAGSDRLHLLVGCEMSLDDALAYAKRSDYFHYYGKGCVAQQLKRVGEAALPLLRLLLDRAADKSQYETALDFLLAMKVPGQVDALVAGIEHKEVRAALDKVAAKHPASVLYAAISRWHASKSRTLEGWTIRLALRESAGYADAHAALSPSVATAFASTLANLSREDAKLEQLPRLLVAPPWLNKIRPQELPTLDIVVGNTPSRITWDAAAQAKHAGAKSNQWATQRIRDLSKRTKNPAHAVLESLFVKSEAYGRALAGEPLATSDFIERSWYSNTPEYLLELPDREMLAIWNAFPPGMWSSYSTGSIRSIIARAGADAIPAFARWVASSAEAGLEMAIDVESALIVPTAMHALKNLKKAKVGAERWIRKYPATTLAVAFVQAFGHDRVGRDNGQFVLRWMLHNGLADAVEALAKAHGGAAVGALEALKAADPLNVLPSKIPKLPSFFVAAAFRRPELPDGAALPIAAVEHVGTMLAISRLDAPYPGIAIIKDTLTATSLAEFAWDLFEAWITAGAPSKDGWAFAALGLLGNDDTARRLAPKIREWPGEAAHARAVSGLDVLAAIGSDMALMHLNAIANKVKFKGLQDRAKEKIAAVADARGLTTDELADRLVPDLGLDESAALTLDFGPRQFTVSFDETLKPFVRDASGARLKDLPKPIRTDDTALAEAATERFKQLKKDAKAIASMQVTRLELAMIGERRWSAADFKLFFLDHPVMRFLATRVLWGVYRDGAWVEGFRVAEDYTLADSNDETYTLAHDATVGVAHVLAMPKAAADAFGQILADYEILQPFKQLGREIYSATTEELKQNLITRYANKTVATGSVMGLVNRGWERGMAQDGGWVGWFTKRITADVEFELTLDPGLTVGYLEGEPTQRVTEVCVRQRGTYDKDGIVQLGAVSPVLVSEVLRDIDMLAPYVEKN